MTAPTSKEQRTYAENPRLAVQTFEFINLTNNQKISDQDRYQVRKQAMKNNTNRRIKGAKHSSKQEAKSGNGLTGPPVIQQALQSRRFRLLPRGLQDLEDKPKLTPLTPKPRSSKSCGLTVQTLGVSPVCPAGDVFTPDPLNCPQQYNWTGSCSGEGVVSESRIASQRHTSPETDAIDRLSNSLSALKHQAIHLDSIPPNLDLLSFLPDSIKSRAQLLIQHNFTDCSRATSFMIPVRKSWFALALSDMAFLDVMLAYYTATCSFSTDRGDLMESISFTAASINFINERLDLPDQRASDGTIAAVAWTVLQETKSGNGLAVKAHLNGLERMISLRGGLFKANFPASLQRMIAWVEIHASSIFSTVPRIIPYASPALYIPSYSCTAGASDPILPSSPFLNRAIYWQTIDTDIERVFADLRSISSIVESDNPKDIEQTDNMWFHDKVYFLQRSLVCLYQSPLQKHRRIDSLSCQTASVYVDSCLCDQMSTANAITILVSKLQTEVASFLLSYDNEPFLPDDETEKTLMWICAFGGIAAYGRPERSWFIKHFSRVCERLFVTEWQQVEQILRGKLWNKRWEDPRESFWHDVVERKANLISGGFVER